MASHDDNYNVARQLGWTPIEDNPNLWENDGTKLMIGTGHLTTGFTRERCDEPCDTPNHFAEETITVDSFSGFCLAGVCVRMNTTEDSMYYGAVDPEGGAGAAFINKYVNGTPTDGASSGSIAAWSTGVPHVVKLVANDSDLELFIDDVSVVTWTDTDVTTGLRTGHVAWGANGALFYFDDHHGEDLSAVGNPANLVGSQVGSAAHLEWDASSGAIDYSIFRRTPQTGALFVPGTDSPLVSGVTDLYYDDITSPADYDYEVFGRLSSPVTPAVASITKTQVRANASTVGITITKPANLADGDVLYAFIGRSLYSNTTGFTCSGWTPLGSAGAVSGNDVQGTMLRKVITNAAGEPSSYTFIASGFSSTVSMVGFIARVTGGDTTTPEDATSLIGSGTNDATPAGRSINTATDDALVIQFCVLSLATTATKTWGVPSGWTPGDDIAETSSTTDIQGGIAYKTQASHGATGTDAWTHAANDSTTEWLTGIVAIKPASSVETWTDGSDVVPVSIVSVWVPQVLAAS